MRAAVRDTELFFDVDGASLVPDGVRMYEKRTAFLVHGGPGIDHSMYKPAFMPLAATLQLVFFDHRGQGRSARGDQRSYTLDQNVEDMEALRRYLGLGQIVSIGSSYGGMVAMAHAARYPDAVSHLILIATASHAGHIERARMLVAERGTAEQIALCDDLWAGRLDTARKFAYYLDVTDPLYSYRFDRARADARRGLAILSIEALNQAIAPGGCQRTLDLRPELGAITARTLILAGRHDWMCAPEFSEELHHLIAGSQLRIFEESGHRISSDEPEALLGAIARFV